MRFLPFVPAVVGDRFLELQEAFEGLLTSGLLVGLWFQARRVDAGVEGAHCTGRRESCCGTTVEHTQVAVG